MTDQLKLPHHKQGSQGGHYGGTNCQHRSDQSQKPQGPPVRLFLCLFRGSAYLALPAALVRVSKKSPQDMVQEDLQDRCHHRRRCHRSRCPFYDSPFALSRK